MSSMKQIFQHYCSFIEWQYEIFDSSQCPLKKLLYGLSDHRSNFFFFFFFSLTLSSHASFYVFFGWCVREKEERKCLSLVISVLYLSSFLIFHSMNFQPIPSFSLFALRSSIQKGKNPSTWISKKMVHYFEDVYYP